MITEDYVSFETGKFLKEKGFNEECRAFYVKSKECGIELFHAKEPYNYNNNVHPCTSAPTLQMVMKWLREKYNIFIDISSRFSKNSDKDVCFSYTCKKLIDTYKTSYEIGDGEWLNYEEACEVAIKYCLENLI